MTYSDQMKNADWELDFYSRPVIESDGKKRWELLITTSQRFSNSNSFRWEKRCPANEVNSIWLTNALKEALENSEREGWQKPSKIRCWRISMKTMIKKAAENIGIDVIESKRTYSLLEWISTREREIYPKEKGFISGPIAPPPEPILNQAIPLPEALRGDSLSLASLPISSLKEAQDWPLEFNELVPINPSLNQESLIPGLRLFSKNRSLALSAWLSGIEPVRLLVEKNQLLLEAGQSSRWLVTDLPKDIAQKAYLDFAQTREQSEGLQFISVQPSPNEQKISGFWMLKDMIYSFT